MTVYIEYAFIENFLFDGTLLFLSLKWAKFPVKWKKISFSASIGAVFAIIFPLLALPMYLSYILKFSMGALLCLFVVPSIKTKKDRGRYALNLVCFLFLAFFFGGALTAILQEWLPKKIPISWIMLGFLFLTVFVVVFIEKLNKKRAIHDFLYECTLFTGERAVQTQGFLDSGNLAKKNNLPVCFLSPILFYELFGENILQEVGQVCDEICVSTVSGIKTYSLYKGKIEVKTDKNSIEKEVYFAGFSNMLSREYDLILSTYIMDEE